MAVVNATRRAQSEDLAWAGATLAERLASAREWCRTASLDPTLAIEAEGEDFLAPWAAACANGDRAAFQRRLDWDGIDVAAARAAMAARAPDGWPAAAWVARLDAFDAHARECAAALGTEAWDAELAAAAGATEPPFIEAWMPMLRWARAALSTAAPSMSDRLTADATCSLERQLLRDLSGVGQLAIWGDFRSAAPPSATGAGRGYGPYVRDLLSHRHRDVLSSYPVLGRHVVLLVDQWVAAVSDFLRHVEEDQPAIETAFSVEAGRVCRLTPGLSDRHGGGRRVFCVEFASGLRLAYKPRDVQTELAFHETLAELRRLGLGPLPRSLRVVDRGSHGWMDWVEQAEVASAAEVRDYFRAAGSLVCITFLLGGADLHGENLVAVPGGPVLIDAEMLLQPIPGRPIPVEYREPGGRASTPTGESCLSPGLPSLLTVGRDGRIYDVGGLQPSPARQTVVAARSWVNLRSDGVQYVETRQVQPALKNDLRLAGVVQRPGDHADAICEGFEAAYRFCLSNRGALLADDGPLRRLGACPTRVLFRPSDQYGALLYLLAAPRYQRRGIDRSLAIETLVRVFAGEVVRPARWPLVAHERSALESLDIPRVTVAAAGTDVVLSTGERVSGCYARSGIAAARRRLAGLCEEDLGYQLDQLRSALSRAARRPAGDGESPDPMVAAAESIALALVERACPGRHESLRWPGCRARADLYAGAGGIALFFAALARVTKGERWAAVARQAMRGMEGWDQGEALAVRGVGACSGRASVAYSELLIGVLLESPSIVARALEHGLAIPAEAIETDLVLDVEKGAAGTLLALIAIETARPDSRVETLASLCASRLLQTQLRHGPDAGAWPAGTDARPRPGLAHGAAGIALALARWAERRPDRALGDAVSAAWAYERRMFAGYGRTWPTVRGDGGRMTMTAWCHGAPGIGLARACTPAGLGDAEVPHEIETAMVETITAPLSHLDHVCCGNLGRAEIVLTVGMRMGRDEWVSRGRATIGAVASLIRSSGRDGMRGQGYLRGAADPGFFQGLAGIGYEMLRAVSPHVVPSVLAFDAPVVPCTGRSGGPR
jgi:type 2 lantibiotic biosynthesis protein LanM